MSDEFKNGKKSDANGAGSYDAHDEAEAEAAVKPLPPLPSPPDRVAELCAACMRFVASKYKVALDGTPDTLSLLDQYVRDARDAMKERPESLDLVAPAIGAYLGEVMRQTFRAEWWAEGDYDGWRLYFTNVYLAFNPLGMGREAVTMSDADGWNAHLTLDPSEREDIEARLRAMPEVDEDEYYLPTTRLDVVSAVVETLRARAEESGTGEVTFSKDDYR
ncbi:MAG TPA: DUF6278 family protein [Labilithrix sp.]|jgi:hypothetical protein|nr:DUF6278 family protein [Labilithrix sp.]